MSFEENEILEFMKKNPRATLQDLANEYGVTKKSISDRFKKLKINWQEIRFKARKYELERYVIEHPDANQKKMANDLGVTEEGLCYNIKKYGIIVPLKWKKLDSKPGISKREIEEYIEKNPKTNQKEIAEYFNYSQPTISRLVERYGINVHRKSTKSKRMEIISKAFQMLNSVKGVSIKSLREFLQNKGIDISEEEIMEYKRKTLQENKTHDDEER